MPTDLDHNNIKDQIVAILKANTSLYNAAQTATDRIYLITTGRPDGETGLDNIFPSLYVTNANPLERIGGIGTVTRGSEALHILAHEFRYKIVFAVNTADARTAELQLDDFQKLILQTLEADHQLKNGGAAVVDSSRPESVETFKDTLNGKPVQGRVITYVCRKVTV